MDEETAVYNRIEALPPETRLSTAEAALLCGCSTRTMRRWKKEGRGPVWVKDGDSQTSHVKYLRSDCERWVNRGHKTWGFMTNSQGLLTTPTWSLGDGVELGDLEDLLLNDEWASYDHMRVALLMLEESQQIAVSRMLASKEKAIGKLANLQNLEISNQVIRE